jgi:hypothetical protein
VKQLIKEKGFLSIVLVKDMLKHALKPTKKMVKIYYHLGLRTKNREKARILLITKGPVIAHLCHVCRKIGGNRRDIVIQLLTRMTNNMTDEQP